MNTSTNQQPTTTVADYLLTGCRRPASSPSSASRKNYNLGILDAIAARQALAWQGMATEQGAGDAADSYARLRGLGAVVTTFGVGELSAINAVAGAYAESVPWCTSSGPGARHQEGGRGAAPQLPAATTGTTPDGDEVTAAQADLRATRALRSTGAAHRGRTSRLVYIAIPPTWLVPACQRAGRLPRR